VDVDFFPEPSSLLSGISDLCCGCTWRDSIDNVELTLALPNIELGIKVISAADSMLSAKLGLESVAILRFDIDDSAIEMSIS
jgi:hypothetical protein